MKIRKPLSDRIKVFSSFSMIIILTAILIQSCGVSSPSFDPKDLSYLYNPTKSTLNPRYFVTNTSENNSVLSVKFFSNELFFSQANPQGVPTAMILITVKLFNTSQGRILADTAFYNLSIVKNENQPEYIYNIPLTVEQGADYLAEIRILDRIRLSVIQAFINFNTRSPYSRNNFAARGHFEKNLLFNPVIRANEYVNLVYLRGHIDSLYIGYYRLPGGVPDAPSMMVPQKTIAEKAEQIVAIPYSDTLPLMFPREGIYHMSPDSLLSDGYTFFNFGASFPEMTTPEDMIEPLAYLATPQEIDRIRNSERPKLALDDFWIACGGNIEKARELIRIFYTRAVYANYYFSSYVEGWRTERGMIYLIYGPPDKVYKTDEGEEWGYRKPVVKSSWGTRYRVDDQYLYFNFKKRISKFSDNDYFLSRNESLVTFWDQAVTSWRKGIVFRLDNPE